VDIFEAFLDEVEKFASKSEQWGPRAKQLGPTKELLKSTDPKYKNALISAALGAGAGGALGGAAKVRKTSRLSRTGKRLSRIRKGGVLGALAGLGIYGAEDIAKHAPGTLKKIAPYSKEIAGAGAGTIGSRLLLGRGFKRQLLGALLGLGVTRAKDVAKGAQTASTAGKKIGDIAQKVHKLSEKIE
jgi:hypothetical protein